MTTKEEERKALAKIKKIIADLGEDSYVAAAFDGCYDVALRNIENDWAFSVLKRAENADAETESLKELIRDLTQEHSNLVRQFRELEAKTLSADDLDTLYHLLCDAMYGNNATLEAMENIILENADTPDSEAFTSAVSKRKICKRNTEVYKALADRIKNIR